MVKLKINGREAEIASARRTQVLKRKRAVRLFADRRAGLFADRRAGKDSWSIFSEVKALAGGEFDWRVCCSPCGDYALVWGAGVGIQA